MLDQNAKLTDRPPRLAAPCQVLPELADKKRIKHICPVGRNNLFKKNTNQVCREKYIILTKKIVNKK